MGEHNKRFDPEKVANLSIAYLMSYPCCICPWDSGKYHECTAGLERETCEAYRIITERLQKVTTENTKKENEKE